MKRKSLIAVLAAIMVMMCSTVCFGADLQIVSSYPEDGQKNTSIENLGVKVIFNNEVNSETLQTQNDKTIKLVDEDGKTVPTQILYSNKDGKMIIVVADTNNTKYKVLNNAEYTLTIGAGFMDNEKNALGQDQVITFKTYNQKLNNWVNMGMMAVMFGGLFLLSARSQNKRDEEKAAEQPEEIFNPYREAKRTGKSVDEVKAAHQAELDKKAKKRAKKHKEEPVYEKHFENCAELLNNVYHVHAPAPTNHADRSIEGLNKLRKEKKAAEKAAAAERKAKNAKKAKKK